MFGDQLQGWTLVGGIGCAQEQPHVAMKGRFDRTQRRQSDIAHVDVHAHMPGRARHGRARWSLQHPLIPLRVKDRDRAQADRVDAGALRERRTHLFRQPLRESVRACGQAAVIIVHWQVIGIALEHPQRLARGEIHHPWNLICLRAEQHVPGTEHVDRHDVRRSAVTVVGESSGVHDDLRAARGLCHRLGVADIASVREVEAAHLVAGAFERLGDGRPEPATMSGEKDDQACSPSRRWRSWSPPRTRRSPRTPRPASLFTIVPVIAFESRREASSTYAPEWSAGSACILSGVTASTAASLLEGCVCVRIRSPRSSRPKLAGMRISVLVAPGETPLTRTMGANSCASWRTIPSAACLLAMYITPPPSG